MNLYDRIRTMLDKRRLVKALDEYETGRERIVASEFYSWLQKKEDWLLDQEATRRLLDDSIDDGWIGKRFEEDYDPVIASMGMHRPIQNTEYIFVRSRGREIIKWYFFAPAVLEKMSLMQLTYFAVTTGIVLILAYFGIHGT